MKIDTPLFVVGAPRSGTKIFRDTLDAHPAISTSDYPLEEIWTYGQEKSPHEAYSPDSLNDEIRSYIQNQFQSKVNQNDLYIEKNVRNSLRIPYIQSVFPQTKFLHIIRDGRDSVTSIRKCWKNPIDWDYYLSSRAFQLNPRDIIYFTANLGWKFLRRILLRKEHVDVWGPHFESLNEMLGNSSLLEISCAQWKACVQSVRSACVGNPEMYFEFKYEKLISNPQDILPGLTEFLNLSDSKPFLRFAEENYRTESIGRWRSSLSKDEVVYLEEEIGDILRELDYKLDGPVSLQ